MSDVKRRDFLKVLGLSGAGAGLVGCAQEPAQKLIPYLVPPEEIIPGTPTWYASACRECPAGCGVHVKVREGRPIKVEGNPSHPVNAGGLCARGQASLQGLYNPDRVTGPMERGDDGSFTPLGWEDAITQIVGRIEELRANRRTDRIYLITDGSVSSLDRLFDTFMDAVGSPNRIVHESLSLEPLREASRRVFGLAEIPRYELDRAQYILSFGADFLSTWATPVGHARRFGQAHSFRPGGMARFVHVAPRLDLTGSNADEWVRARAGTARPIALALARILVEEGRDGGRGAGVRELLQPFTPERAAEAAGVEVDTIVRLAHELADSPASVVVPPGHESLHAGATADHAAVHLLNYLAGNIGRTVRFGPNLRRRPAAGLERFEALVEAMRAGEVELLLVHGADPAYTLPGGLGFAEALENVGLAVSFASHRDETAALCDLILPDHTPLESWGDHEPEAGVRTLMQPTVDPLFDTRATGDLLIDVAAALGGDVAARLAWPDFRSYVQESWRTVARDHAPRQSFESFWRQAVSRGGVWRDPPPQPVTLRSDLATSLDFEADAALQAPGDESDADALTLLACPSPVFYDGRGANRPWLQELPDPVTKVVWNSWIELHPETAAQLDVKTGDVVRVSSDAMALEVPVYVYPGIRPDTVAVPIGQGHEHFGRYARDRGVNPLDLLDLAADDGSGAIAWLTTGVTLRRTGRRTQLVVTQGSETDHGREVAELMSLPAAAEAEEHAQAELAANPDELVHAAEDADPKSPYRWGMAIDLSSCIGCSACVTACYAENNVPVVGEDLCDQGREMAWLRIERFFEPVHAGGDAHGESGADPGGGAHAGPGGHDDALHTVHVPMLCQHCGNAPCEPVCPVYATYHNPEGLNVQVYNRCVGTRYCSNNCPYKVRRFEWFSYEFPYPLNLQLNPDVTVREKGVMEKCTFCVQRITAAKNEAVREGRDVRDGEITPACAATCPTDAIVFGNLRDPDSRVSRLARGGRAYHVLGELNTRPAVTYLKDVTHGGGEG